MAGNRDLIEILREIRGSGVPGEVYTNGIWYELTIADKAGNPGIYGDILAKYGILTESAGTFDQAVAILENLNVEVTTLPAGTQATSALVNGVWQIGIPRGTAGIDGDDGLTPAVAMNYSLGNLNYTVTVDGVQITNTALVNLDGLVDTIVNANVDVQTTLAAKQDVLDAVVDAQAIADGLDANVAAKIAEISAHTVTKIGELSTASDNEKVEIGVHADVKVAEYDANAVIKTHQYNDNHEVKLAAYNANDTTKLAQYNTNHIERLENLDEKYATRIIDMLNTNKILGMVDKFAATVPTQYATFLDTVLGSYIYYLNGTILTETVDYTVVNGTTIQMTTALGYGDIVTQVDSRYIGDYLTFEGVILEERIGQPEGVAGLDENGKLQPGILAQDVNNRFVTDTEKSIWNGKTSTSIATTVANGLMSSTDKTKLDDIIGTNTGDQTTIIGNAGTATKLQTPRAIQVSGAVTGTADFDGGAAINIVTTNTAAPVITLAGDATGSVTLTNLSSGTLTVSIVDDSHNHVISNINGLQTAIDAKVDDTEKGVANGIATLDANGKVVLSQINDSILGQLEYKGVWNLATMPTATEKGQYWVASAAGNGYEVGDWAVYNGATFDKVDNTDAVASVAGRTGVVVLTKTDVGLGNVDNTADSAKNVLYSTTAGAVTGQGALATLSSVNASTITDNSVGAAELNVTGNGTTSQYLRSNGDGTFTWATPTDTDTVYTHPASHAPSIITQDASNRFVTDTEKATWNGKASTSVATTSVNGLMSSTDKIELNNKATDSTVVHKTGDETIEGVKTFSSTIVGLSSLRTNGFASFGYGTTDGIYLANYGSSITGIQFGGISVGSGAATIQYRRGNGSLAFMNGDASTQTDRMVIDLYGNVLVTGSGGLGYGTGSGGTVTQLTSKSTEVTLNKPCGTIVTAYGALAGGATVTFTFNNTTIGINDILLLTGSSQFSGTYSYLCGRSYAGSTTIGIKNLTAGTLDAALNIDFILLKGARA